MGSALAELGVGIEDLPLSLHSALSAIDDMIAAIPSGIRYAVTREPATDGNDELHLRSEQKIGQAAGLESRFDSGAPLAGTKLTAVRRRQPLVVLGIRDGAKLLVFPILRGGRPVEVVLLHLELGGEVGAKVKLRFLEAFPQRTEQLADYFGEVLGTPGRAARARSPGRGVAPVRRAVLADGRRALVGGVRGVERCSGPWILGFNPRIRRCAPTPVGIHGSPMHDSGTHDQYAKRTLNCKRGLRWAGTSRERGGGRVRSSKQVTSSARRKTNTNCREVYRPNA